MADLTVVIVTFNRQPMLNELLAKLSTQTVLPEVIIGDDGTRDHIFGHEWPVVKRYLWTRHDGYQRVARFNESVALVDTKYILLLDDDCLPLSNDFIAAHMYLLEPGAVVRGLGQKLPEQGGGFGLPGWFSSCNVSMATAFAQAMGPFDMAYNGSYSHEDNDLGMEIERRGLTVVTGTDDTAIVHRGEIHHEYHVGVEKNRSIYHQKWG